MLTTLILVTALSAPCEGDTCRVDVFATVTREGKLAEIEYTATGRVDLFATVSREATLAEVTYTVTGRQPVRRTVGAVAKFKPVRRGLAAFAKKRPVRRLLGRVVQRVHERPRIRGVRRAVFGR